MGCKRLFSLALLAAIVTSCVNQGRCPGQFSFPTQTTYSVHATETTPKGIAVDPSGLPISLALVDRLTDEVETCLMATFPDGNLTPLVAQGENSTCLHGTKILLPLPRSCMTVKVASDWHLSTDEFAGSYQQLLHDVAVGAPADCGKGETGTGPCYWRAGIQNNTTIVTTPSFYVYKQYVMEIATGCLNSWNSPELSGCMTPTTGPLSDGTGP